MNLRAALGRLPVSEVGPLVPEEGFSASVHSRFERAVNLRADGGLLLTITLPGVPMGPSQWRLVSAPPGGLAPWFADGERLQHRAGCLHGARCTLDARAALRWRPVAMPALGDPAEVQQGLAEAHARLQQWRAVHPNVLDREAAPFCAALLGACRLLDAEAAAQAAQRLVGWGEGLTPAGDDFLVGLFAALDVPGGADAPKAVRAGRRALRQALADAVSPLTCRTVDLSAQQLTLAASGHIGETMAELRYALLAAPGRVTVAAALEAALALGASSGADMASGLLGGLAAWLPGAGYSAGLEGR